MAGVVTVIEKGEEKTYSDTCHPTKNAVKQYYCRNGRAYLYKRGDYSWLSCGRDRKCVVDEATGAGKCVDKEEAGETTSLEGLRRIVQNLQERIEALEEAVSELQEALFAEEWFFLFLFLFFNKTIKRKIFKYPKIYKIHEPVAQPG